MFSCRWLLGITAYLSIDVWYYDTSMDGFCQVLNSLYRGCNDPGNPVYYTPSR